MVDVRRILCRQLQASLLRLLGVIPRRAILNDVPGLRGPAERQRWVVKRCQWDRSLG